MTVGVCSQIFTIESPMRCINVLQKCKSEAHRAARMVADSGIHAKHWSVERATDYLMRNVGLPRYFAEYEARRYAVVPGQATAYYYGYNKMQALRAQTELKLRDSFDQQAFHDFLLSQGMLPPDILKDAVMNEFVPSQLN